MNGLLAHVDPAGDAVDREFGLARQVRVVTDEIPVQGQGLPLTWLTAAWKAALRLAYQPALKSAKR